MRTFILTSLILLIGLTNFGQPPQAFKYQAVVRNNSGGILQNHAVGIRISIHDSTTGGTIVYQETFSETTNDFGLVNLEIGTGIPTIGIFTDIDWGNNSKFIETEIDPSNGTAYVSMGTSELLAVPYALFSDRSSLVSNDGTGNIYVGDSVAKINTTGHSNAYVGFQSGYNNSTGYVNSFLGYRSGYNNSSGSGNTFVGNISGYNNSTGGLNTIVGDRSGLGNTEGNRNTYLGYKSGNNNSTGSSNICIGYKAGFYETGSNKLYIHNESSTYPLIYGEFDNNSLTINGKLGIGTSTPEAGLHIKGTNWPGSFLYLQSDTAGDAGMRLYEGTTAKWHIFNNAADDRLMIYNSDATEVVFVADQTYGNVGIGTCSFLSSKLTVQANNDAFFAEAVSYGNYGWVGNQFAAIRGYSPNDVAVKGWTDNGLAGDFHGDVLISGSISKGSGSFLIDHPLDPENKLLRHNFMESPENLVVYRGKIKLNSIGENIVELPEYFEALTKENEATVVLTSIGKPFLTGYEWENDFKSFKIYGEFEREVSWVVYADRDDPVIHELGQPVEEEKGPDNPYCEKGKLLYPRAYGYPESTLKDYDEMIKMKEPMNRNNNATDSQMNLLNKRN